MYYIEKQGKFFVVARMVDTNFKATYGKFRTEEAAMAKINELEEKI